MRCRNQTCWRMNVYTVSKQPRSGLLSSRIRDALSLHRRPYTSTVMYSNTQVLPSPHSICNAALIPITHNPLLLTAPPRLRGEWCVGVMTGFRESSFLPPEATQRPLIPMFRWDSQWTLQQCIYWYPRLQSMEEHGTFKQLWAVVFSGFYFAVSERQV